MTPLIALALWIALAATCTIWLLRRSTPPRDPSPLREVVIYARPSLHAGRLERIALAYDTVPSRDAMVGTFVWLLKYQGFTIAAADLACDALYEAIVAREMAAFDEELLGLRGAA